MNNILIVFARAPNLGKVKTRLAIKLGDIKALEVYNNLLNKTLHMATVYSNATAKIYWSEKQIGKEYYQRGTGLGERMLNAINNEFISDEKICLIGTDVPNLSSTILNQAYKNLNDNDIVFGPSFDGGYYLIGCKRKAVSELFLNKTWSHENVLKEALAICKTLNLKVALLPTLLDIDTVEDYNKWKGTTL